MNLGPFGIAVLCFLPWLDRKAITWRAGAELSLILTIYFSLQAFALLQSGVHDSAFIQTLDTLFVPFFMSLGGQRPGFKLWLASGLAFSGVAIMTHQGGALSLSDVWSLLAAFCYALYLLRIDHWAQRVPSLALTASQSICGTMLSLIWVLSLEPQWLAPAQIAQISWPNLLYLGVLATGVTTFLHLWGQRRINATQAAVTLALDPVWASFFAWLLLRQSPGFQGLVGGGVILIATFLCVAATHHKPALVPEPATRIVPLRREAHLLGKASKR